MIQGNVFLDYIINVGLDCIINVGLDYKNKILQLNK